MEQLSPLNDFTSFWRHENAQSGVVYKTCTVLKILLELQIIHTLCFFYEEFFYIEGRLVDFSLIMIILIMQHWISKCKNLNWIILNLGFLSCSTYWWSHGTLLVRIYKMKVTITFIKFLDINWFWSSIIQNVSSILKLNMSDKRFRQCACS